jgi:hypothetical protein
MEQDSSSDDESGEEENGNASGDGLTVMGKLAARIARRRRMQIPK